MTYDFFVSVNFETWLFFCFFTKRWIFFCHILVIWFLFILVNKNKKHFSLIFVLYFWFLYLLSILRLQQSPSLLCTVTIVTGVVVIYHDVSGKGTVYLFSHSVHVTLFCSNTADSSVNPVIISKLWLCSKMPLSRHHIIAQFLFIDEKCNMICHSSCFQRLQVFILFKKKRSSMNIFLHTSCWQNEHCHKCSITFTLKIIACEHNLGRNYMSDQENKLLLYKGNF